MAAKLCTWHINCATSDERDGAVIAYFLLGLALLVGAVLIGRWFISSDPKLVIKVSGRVLLGMALLAGAYMAMAGRITWAVALIAVLSGIGLIVKTWARTAQVAATPHSGPATGQTSDIETQYLRLSLDHYSGVTTGEVLKGKYAGRTIDSLSIQELSDLLSACRNEDSESAQVLEAYLNRVYPDWWPRFGPKNGGAADNHQAGPQGESMSLSEAYDVLGLKPGCSPNDIKEAHRRLMVAMHPDRGGSTYLASKLNQAKDRLLNP